MFKQVAFLHGDHFTSVYGLIKTHKKARVLRKDGEILMISSIRNVVNQGIYPL
jgi:hypothetical protein